MTQTTPGADAPACPVIQVSDLHKVFPVGFRRKKVYAVRGITFDVHDGDIFGFLGPNGAGKTTTIKMLTGLIRPAQGAMQMFGRDVEDLEVRRQVGYLPEQPYFYDYLTPTELLEHFGRLFGIPRAERRRRIDELITRVGLDHARKRTLRKFSKGMLQRAGIAQALINDPQLIILDEPLTGLDPIGRKEMMDIMFDLKRRGKTVFFSSHILSDIERVCDRVAIIRQGRIVSQGALSDLLTHDGMLVEITFKLPDPEAGSSLEGSFSLLERFGDQHRGKVDEAGVNVALAALVAADAEILALDRRRESLEDLFMREAIIKEGADSPEVAP
jgi:ABC-2 type transport system ATP-binding protein